MPPSVASSVSLVRTRTKLPSGVIGPRIFLPSSVHSFANVAAKADTDSEGVGRRCLGRRAVAAVHEAIVVAVKAHEEEIPAKTTTVMSAQRLVPREDDIIIII
jgi:hypothetical protein